MANLNRANLITESATLFPDNNTQEISPADLRSWLADGTASFVTQKDKSTLENAIFENQGSTLAASSTVDLNAATGNYLHISGTGTINSFGTCPAGARFILMFEAAATLTYNATSLIIPGLANKTAAAGDCCMIVSEGGGNWRIVGYFAISGGGGGGSGTVTSVATAGLISGGPITTSGTISTSMATDKLVGRYSAGTGIMQEVTIGSGLTLTGAGILNNTATATPLGYYAMYQDLVTQTNSSSNLGYPMKFRTLDYSNQVTVVSDTRITFANAGVYNLQFSSQFQNIDNVPHDVTIWLRLNGTDVPGSAGFMQIPARRSASAGNEGHIITGWNYLIDVPAGVYYEIVWSTSDHTQVTMQFYAAGSPPPSTASTIFTVTQQAGILAGTGITGMVGTTGPTQTGATQTMSSSDMTITSAANAHTFAIPSAAIATKGLVDLTAQTFTGIKSFGNGASAGEIRLLEGSGSGTNYVALKAQPMGSDYSLTLPTSAGSSGNVLITDGSGGLSWANNGGAIATQFLKNTTATTIPSPIVGNTIIETLLIPAGTYSSNNSFNILFKSNSTITTTAVNLNLSVNTTASLIGALLVSGPKTLNSGIAAFSGSLGFNLYGGGSGNTTRYIEQPYTNVANIGSSTTTIDWSVNQYLILWASASATRNMTNILISTTPT